MFIGPSAQPDYTLLDEDLNSIMCVCVCLVRVEFVLTWISVFTVCRSGLNCMYEISFLWYSFIGCVLTVSIGLIVSFATSK